jgi:Tautomerase enzyme
MRKQRPKGLKQQLYREMTAELSRAAAVLASDVMICVLENSRADRSFGNGRAQFLTGELA